MASVPVLPLLFRASREQLRCLWVISDAVGEVLIQNLLRAAMRAFCMELVLGALLVPPMNISIRPIGRRAHKGVPQRRSGHTLAGFLHVRDCHLLHLVKRDDVHRERLSRGFAGGPQEVKPARAKVTDQHVTLATTATGGFVFHQE